MASRVHRNASRARRAAIESYRASVENPNVPLTDADAWEELFGAGGRASSGAVVTKRTALTYAALWRGVNDVARDCAKLPLVVWRRTAEDGKETDKGHPAYRLLRWKPNQGMTAFVFFRTLVFHALLWGNGYAYIRRSRGEPVELVLLNPDRVEPLEIGGEVVYRVQRNDGRAVPIPAADVFHLRGLGFDGLKGYDVVSLARDSLGTGLAARDYASTFFVNGAGKRVLIKHPKTLSEKAAKNFVSGWRKLTSSADGGTFRTLVLEEGMEPVVVGVSGREAQMQELREFELREVANWIGLPPHKVGDTTRTSYNSLEAENQSYLDGALDGWLVAIEFEAWDKLLSEREKEADSHFVEYRRQALVRADLKTRGEYYWRATGGRAWLTADEIRRKENEPLRGGIADELTVPANMNPESVLEAEGDDDDEPPPPPVDDGQGDDEEQEGDDRTGRALVAILRASDHVASRMKRRLAFQARKAAKNPRKWGAFIERLDDENRPAIEAAFGPVCDALEALGHDVSPSERADALLEDARRRAEEAYDSPRSKFEATVGELFPLETPGD